MKIVYLHQYFSTPETSGGTRSFEMARRLVSWGHEVHMVTSDRARGPQSKRWRVETIDGITVHWLPVEYSNDMGFRQRISSFLKFALRSGPRARRLHPDLVFATSTPLTIAVPALYATVGKRVPLVFEVRDLWPAVPIALGLLNNKMLQFGARTLERVTYRRSKHIVALSPGMKQGIVATGVSAEKITVIPNSADLELFAGKEVEGDKWRAERPWLGDRPMVLYCGTLGHVNNIDYMVRIAKVAQKLDPDACFVTVGEGARKDHVRDLARQLGVLDVNFFMCESQPKTAVPAVFAAATLSSSFVLPVREMEWNSANKFFDALAAGKPIVINHGGWQADLLSENGAGISVPPNDPDRAAEMIIELLHDSARLNQAGQASAELARSKFSRDDLAHKLNNILTSAAKG